MAFLSPPPKLQFFDAAGVPLVGGKLYSYAAGTTTPLATYTSQNGLTANTNPIILDSRGEANVWLSSSSYKLKLTDSTDVLIWTVDNIQDESSVILATLAGPNGASLIGYGSETVADALDRAGEANANAWGNIKQNTSDYATIGANLMPAFGALTKVNFDGSGNHAAGSIGTLTGSVTGAPFSYYLLKIVVTTITPGYVALNISNSTIFGDLPEYYFSNAAVLNDGGENNQYVTTNDYYFYIPTSTSGFANFSVATDTLWAGQISAIEMYEVDQTKFAVGGCGSETNGPENPVGLKVGAFNRNDTAVGNIYTLGLMSYDGVLPIPAQNVAMGSYALASNWKGDENTAYGTLALAYNEGSNNVGLGYSALKFNTKGQENTAIGYKSAVLNTTGFRNTFVGMWSGAYNRTSNYNTRVGWSPIIAGGLSGGDTSMGAPAGTAVLTGSANCFYGAGSGVVASGQATLNLTGVSAFGYNTKPWGNYSTAIGFGAAVGAEGAFADYAVAIGYNSATPVTNTVAIGANALVSQQLGTAIGYNSDATEAGTAVGYNAQATGLANSIAIGRDSVATGEQSVVVGPQAEGVAYRNVTIGSQAGVGFNGVQNTFLGAISGVQAVAYTNCTLLGYSTAVTGSNQVQLGNASTTTYAYGAVQNRSDNRDKADVRSTVLGLDFINALRPVDFKWDMRQDYFDEVSEEIEVSVIEKQMVNTGNVDDQGRPVFEEREVTVVRKQPSTKFVPVEKDGSRKRNRFHHGLIAQEVKAACDAAGVDFGGYQDHSIKGGADVLSIGYEELIAPLIKAIQQLSLEVADLKSKLP
jgi:hypothetical protein